MKHAKIDPRQANGSVYGMIPAHRGYDRPIGEWNFMEVTVKGPTIAVELNGTRIVDGRREPGEGVHGRQTASG